VHSLESDQIATKLNETYLFSPLDSTETILSSNTILLQNQKYWVIETNNHDFFVIENKDPTVFINEEKLNTILRTYFFFSKMNEQNNKKIAYFFNQVPGSITNFNYNLELIKSEIEHLDYPDQNVINGIQNIETRAIAIGNETITLTNNILELDSNLTILSSESFNNIKEINKTISNTSESLIQKLNLLQQSILELKKTLIDANIPTELKYNIGNNALILPEQIIKITEYLSYENQYIEEITNAIKYSDESNYDSFKKNWEIRLKRASFLSKYLANDKDINTKTKLKTPKELFDLIINNPNIWKNTKETNAFINAYNKMNQDLSKAEYDSAERQLKPLKDSALRVFNDGKNITTSTNTTTDTTNTTTEEENNPIFTIALICLGAIVLIIIIINVIKKVKEMKEKSDKEEETKDVEVNFN
jgi:hypothetical protein